MIHNFNRSLALSHYAAGMPIWDELYRRAFPGFLASYDHRQDGEHQRAGIDKSIILANAKQILIDEKSRWGEYDDIAIEYWSNEQRSVPGWACKPMRADFICYAIHPTGKAYLLPVPALQAAWARKGEFWKQKHFEIRAYNEGYTTVSCAVPVKDLFKEIGASLRLTYEPISEDEALLEMAAAQITGRVNYPAAKVIEREPQASLFNYGAAR